MDKKIELFSSDLLERRKRENRIWERGLIIFAVAALAVCIILCAVTNTANSGVTGPAVIAVSIVCGWIFIYFWIFRVQAEKRLCRHAETMLTGQREATEGVCERTDELVRIKGSITIRKLRLTGESGARRVSAEREAADRIPCGVKIRLYTVNNYACAYEVLEGGDEDT